MRIILSNTSCVIDLRKADLLEALFRLPYAFVVSDILFEDGESCLTLREKRRLLDLGLEVQSMPGELVSRAHGYFNEHPLLTVHDCFALALAVEMEDCILLADDTPLRRVAEANRIDVRGVPWVIGELQAHQVEPATV